MIQATAAAVTLGKRKVCELKDALGKLGYSLRSRELKSELECKYDHAQAILDLRNVPHNHTWTRVEFDVLMSELVGLDSGEWDPATVVLIRGTYYLRCFSIEVTSDEDCMKMINNVEDYYKKFLTESVKHKTEVITADSISPLMQQLLNKPVGKWGDKEGDKLVTMFGNVKGINATGSTQESLDQYRQLNDLLSVFYVKRPDIKVKVDPDVVTFDLSAAMEWAACNAGGMVMPGGANGWLATAASGVPGSEAAAAAAVGVIDLYTRRLAAYPANNFPVAGPAQAVVLPPKSNPGPVPLTFVITANALTNHFIGWMQSAVPRLQATVTGTQNVPLIYL